MTAVTLRVLDDVSSFSMPMKLPHYRHSTAIVWIFDYSCSASFSSSSSSLSLSFSSLSMGHAKRVHWRRIVTGLSKKHLTSKYMLLRVQWIQDES